MAALCAIICNKDLRQPFRAVSEANYSPESCIFYFQKREGLNPETDPANPQSRTNCNYLSNLSDSL